MLTSPYYWHNLFYRFMITEVVVSLEAPDEFLKNRVMNLPESVVAGTHNTEEGESFPFPFDIFPSKSLTKFGVDRTA